MVCSAGCLTGDIIFSTFVDTLSAELGAFEVGDCQRVLGGIRTQSIRANAGVS